MPRVRYDWVDASTWGVGYMVKFPLFSFGSNLNPVQLLTRAPGAVFLSTARINFARLGFYGDSPKRGGVATLRQSGAHKAWAPGILTTVTRADVESLDRFEGNGKAYRRHLITVAADRDPVRAFTYLRCSDVEAGPVQDYVDKIAAGYRFFGFDPDTLRRAVDYAPACRVATVDAGDLAVRQPRQSGPRSPRPPGGRLGGAALIPNVPTMDDVRAAEAELAARQAPRKPVEDDHPGRPAYTSVYRVPAGRPIPGPYAQPLSRTGEPMMPEWWMEANGPVDNNS